VSGRTQSDDPTFEAAFDGLYRKAYWMAYRLLRSHEDSEDVAIETLARASVHWRRINGYPKPWVTRVSANLAIDTSRRRRDQVELQDIALPEEAAAERMDLLDAVRRLPKRQRTTIALRFYAGLSEHETAEILGCSPGTVKQHMSRAVRKLRLEVTEDGAGGVTDG
jgi:RNA polymerase sigma factor (sigma-70 family)